MLTVLFCVFSEDFYLYEIIIDSREVSLYTNLAQIGLRCLTATEVWVYMEAYLWVGNSWRAAAGSLIRLTGVLWVYQIVCRLSIDYFTFVLQTVTGVEPDKHTS